MGLCVVSRLAARHGVKVRLQPATTGGLTALVWLPDEIAVLPGAAADLDPAEPDAMATSAPGSGPGDGPGLRPRHARPGLRLRAPVQLPASRQAFSWSEAAGKPAAQATSTPGTIAQAAGARPPGEQAAAGHDTESPAEQRRLPIYEAVESDWFSRHGQLSGADSGWDAAKTVLAPASDGVTTSGLPVRTPRANLVPGAIGRPQPDPALSARSADAARNRLAGFQRGASRGRAAAGGQDETP
jgi:hypothetical protein